MIEKVAEKAIEAASEKNLEKPQTPVEKHFSNLEKSVNVELTEKIKNEIKIADWWDNKLTNEKEVYRGGSYGELKEDGYGWPDHEVHHMPADSASELPRADGPAIAMDYTDHRQTASCGISKEAAEYRQEQKELITQGKFLEAFRMDVDDIHAKFGNKYDKAIAEAQEYAKKFGEEGHA